MSIRNSKRRNRKASWALAAAAGAVMMGATARAGTYYWDLNGATAGSGAAPSGAWDSGVSSDWSSDPTGSSTTSAITTGSGDALYFAAGPAVGSGDTNYTVSVSGTQTAGGLNFQSSAALTTVSGGTGINLGAGGITLAQYAYGTTSTGGVTVSTPIALQAAQAWTNNSGSLLTISGGIDNGANTLTVAGTGGLTISGVIGNGATRTGGLVMNGTGTLNMTGANLYTGATYVASGTLALSGSSGSIASSPVTLSSGGTLTISNTAAANNADRIASLTSNGGTFNFTNDAGAASFSETLTSLTLNAGSLKINTSQAASGQTAVLNLGTVTRNAGGTLLISGTGVDGALNTRNQIQGSGAGVTATNGVIPWIVLYDSTGHYDFANVSGSNLIATTGYDTSTGNSWVATTNARPPSGTDTPNGGKSLNSLTLDNGAIVAGGATERTLTFTTGGILQTGGGSSAIVPKSGSTNSYTLAFGGSEAIIQVMSGGTLTFQPGKATTAFITGSGGVTKSGPGTLVLGTTAVGFLNNDIGVFRINEGTVQVFGGLATSFGSTGASIALGGGNLDIAYTAGVTFSNANTTVSGNSTITSDNGTASSSGQTYVFGTLGIGGSNGSQTLTIAGGSNVNSGTAGVTFLGTTLNGPSTFNITKPAAGGTTLLTVGAISNGTNTLTLAGNGNFAQAGVMGNGAGGLTLASGFSGTATLSQTNTYSGPTTINGGTLTLTSAGSIGTGSISIGGGGTFNTSAYSSYTLPANLAAPGSGPAAVTAGAGGVVAGSHTINMQDGTNIGTLSFNTGLSLNGATLNFDLGNSGADTINIGGAATLGGTNIINVAALRNASSLVLGLQAYTLLTATGGGLSNSSFSLNGSGILNVGANSYLLSLSGDANHEYLTVSPNVPAVTWCGQNAGGLGATTDWNTTTRNWKLNSDHVTDAAFAVYGGVTFDDNATGPTTGIIIDPVNGVTPSLVTFSNKSKPYSFAATGGAIMGSTTSVTVSGGGSVTFSNANSYGSGIAIGTAISNGSTVTAGNVAALGAVGAGVSLTGGATLDLATDSTVNAYNITINGPATIKSDTATSGHAGVTHTLGTLAIGGQTLTIGVGPNATGGGTAVVAFSGSTTLSGSPTFSIATGAQLTLGAVTGSSNTINLTGAGKFAQTGAIGSGGGGLTLDSGFTGTATLSQANAYTGGTQIQNGTLRVGATNALAAASTVTFGSSTATNGTLDLNGYGITVAGLAVAPGATAGSQRIGSSTAGVGPAVLTFTNTATPSNFGGSIMDNFGAGSQTTGLTVSANSSLTLSGPNTYTGPTSVSGTLVVASPGSLGNTTVTVNSGGKLQGDGTIAGAITNSGTGTIQPRVSGTTGVTLTAGSLNLIAGANLVMTLGSSSDLISVSGTAALAGAETLTITGGSGFGANTYTIINSTGLTDGASFTVSSPLGYYSVVAPSGNALTVQVMANNVTWTGATNTNWSTATGDANWTGLPINYFQQGAAVTFDDSTANKTVNVSGPVQPRSVVVNTNSTYTLQGSGVIGDSGLGATAITMNSSSGTGKLIINNGANTYTGGVTLNSGTLQINADTSLGAVPSTAKTSLTFGGNATLQAGSSITLNANRNIAISGAYNATIDTQANSLTIGGVISGASAAGLTKTGTGTLTLSNVNTYAGGTTISAGTLTVTNPGALSSGTVTLNGTSPALRLSPSSQGVLSGISSTGGGATQWTVNQTGGFTPAVTTGTLQMTSTAGNEATSAWYNTQANLAYGFTAQFTYTYTTAGATNPPADGVLFVMQSKGLTALGGNGGSKGANFNKDAGVGIDLFSNAMCYVSNSSTTTNNPSNGGAATGINLRSGDPLQVIISASSTSSSALSVTIKDLTTSVQYQTSCTLTDTIHNLLGSDMAWFGFTGGTGQDYAIQSVGGFSFSSGQTVYNATNSVLVQADSTIDVNAAAGASLGSLSIGANTLNITNTGGGGATLTLGATTLSGAPTFASAAGVALTLGALDDGGSHRTITVNGASTGTVVLGTPATSLVAGTVFAVQGGVLSSTNATALGGLATVNVNDGATFRVGASQTIAALGDYAASPSGNASVTLNGNTLTVGEAVGNLPSTFTGHITDGTAAGSLIKAGTGALTLNNTSTYTGGTTIQAGTIVVGAANALPTTGTLRFGPASATLDLFGHSQQVGGLAVTGGSAVIGNSSATPATLTFAGGTSTFGGLIQDTLPGGSPAATTSLLVSSGNLTLSNGSNSYSGGTQIAGGTLTLTNGATGSATGSGPVLVTSGALAGNGTMTGTLNVYPSAHVAPHTASTTGTLRVGSGTGTVLTLQDSAILDFNFGAPGADNAHPGAGDMILVNGNASIGVATLNVSTLSGFGEGWYELVGFSGSLSGTAAFTVNSVPAQYNYSVVKPTDSGGVTGEILMHISLKPAVTWTGAAGSGGNATWNLLSSNWSSGSYSDFVPVIFDDTGANRTISVGGNYSPPSVTFNNNDNSYSLSDNSITVATELAVNGTGLGTVLIGSTIAGAGKVTMNGASTLTLTGTNTYTGGTTINSGTIAVNNAASLGASSGALAINNGTLRVMDDGVNHGFTSTRSITLGHANSAISVDNNVTYTANGTISGPAGNNLNATGAGTLVLGGANAFAGQTIIQSGTVQVATFAAAGSNQPLGANANPVVIGTGSASTATLAFNNGTNSASAAIPIALGSAGGAIAVSNSAATLTLTGPLTGGALTVKGPGTLALSNTNSYSNGTNVTAGATLRVVNNTTLGSGAVSLSGGSKLKFANNQAGSPFSLTSDQSKYAVSSSWNGNTENPATVASWGPLPWQAGANGNGAPYAQPDFIMVDLGATHSLAQVNINWNQLTVNPATFTFYTAPAGTPMTSLYTSPLGTSNPLKSAEAGVTGVVMTSTSTQMNTLNLSAWTQDSVTFTTPATTVGADTSYPLYGIAGEYLVLYVTARNPGNHYGMRINQITPFDMAMVTQTIDTLNVAAGAANTVDVDPGVALTANTLAMADGAALSVVGNNSIVTASSTTFAGTSATFTPAAATTLALGNLNGQYAQIVHSGLGTLLFNDSAYGHGLGNSPVDPYPPSTVTANAGGTIGVVGSFVDQALGVAEVYLNGNSTLALAGTFYFDNAIHLTGTGTATISAQQLPGASSSGTVTLGSGFYGSTNIIVPAGSTLNLKTGANYSLVAGATTFTGPTGSGLSINGQVTIQSDNSATFTGTTTVASGTLVLANATGAAVGGDVVLNGGTLASSGWTAAVGGTLRSGSGPASVAPGGIGAVGNLTAGGLSLGSLTTLNFADNNSNQIDQINTAGALAVASTVNIQVSTSQRLNSGTYKLIGFGSTTATASNFQLNGGATPPGYVLQFNSLTSPTELDLVVQGVGFGSGWWIGPAGGTWSTTNNTNWNSGLPARAGDVAYFDTGGGTVNVAGPITVGGIQLTSSTAFTIAGSALTIDNGAGTSEIRAINSSAHQITAPLTLNSSTSFNLASRLTVGNLTVNPAVTASIDNIAGNDPAYKVVLVTGPVTATGTGKVDVKSNALKVTGSDYATVKALLTAGSIVSSWTDATQNHGLQVLAGSDARLNGNTANFAGTGMAIADADVLVQCGWNGDLNMDNAVDYLDYGVIDNGYLGSLSGYAHGDLNNDGAINYLDYGMIDNAYLAQTAPHSAGAAAAAMSASAVPEPAGLLLLSVGCLALLPRRRRHS